MSCFSCCAGPFQIKSKTDLGACFEGFHRIDFLQGLNKDDFFSYFFFSDCTSILLARIMGGWECEMCTKYIMKLDFSKLSPNDLKHLGDLCSACIYSSSSCCQVKEDELVLGPSSYLMHDNRRLQIPLGVFSQSNDHRI